MAKLKAKARNALPSSDFALPGRAYPIEDASHARNALSRVAQNGSPAEQATVRRKVAAKYPGIGKGHPAKGGAGSKGDSEGAGDKTGSADEAEASKGHPARGGY